MRWRYYSRPMFRLNNSPAEVEELIFKTAQVPETNCCLEPRLVSHLLCRAEIGRLFTSSHQKASLPLPLSFAVRM